MLESHAASCPDTLGMESSVPAPLLGQQHGHWEEVSIGDPWEGTSIGGP